jgi:TIR domain
MHDLFLSYNRADADAVREARAQLEARGIRTFIDWHDLDAGRMWPDALERALRGSRVVAVFVGKTGFGVWQKREVYYALDLQARSPEGSRPVVPVLLRGADPPAGFLALNTWVDLRDGINKASIEPLVRMLEGVAQPAPRVDLCPYRDLRSFREEDAALFFGRDEAIAAIVGKVDCARFVAIVGPSGSGKSSVAIAGVLPRLRGRRPPAEVWEGVILTPGAHPWRSFADALVPLVEPELSGVEKIRKGGLLNEALQQENGIASTIAHALKESRGTDRLLVVIDQFEELFTLIDADVARGFLRALFDASRSVPLTVLVTVRSDHYGKAIALDRDLSDALADAQVNLGPMRPDELREIVTKPASIAGLSFEAGLVDRILDDVGDEPGNLPLLEYALSELWELRSDRALTFAAYQEIGGVSGALAKRANALYNPLSTTEKSAARRLMTRLVRVSAADEEGADTRRLARREEIDDEAWKLVDPFVRARLLVVGESDVVEVAHEALIRKWDRLREWLNEDRKFLLWRQQLAVYRDAWPDVLPAGAILDEAQNWWRARRTELSVQEHDYIARSATTMMRSRRRVRMGMTAAALLLIACLAWLIYTRSGAYNIQRILDQRLEDDLLTKGPEDDSVANLVFLIRIGREKQILNAGPTTTSALVRRAVAMHDAGKDQVAQELLKRAKDRIASTRDPFILRLTPHRLLAVADGWARIGRPDTARALVEEVERKSRPPVRSSDLVPEYVRDFDREWREMVADTWRLAGRPDRARRTLLSESEEVVHPELLDSLIRLNDPADVGRIAKSVDALLASLKLPDSFSEAAFLRVVQAFVDVGNLDQAQRMADASPTRSSQDEALKKIAVAKARLWNQVPDSQLFDRIDSELTKEHLCEEVMADFVRRKRHEDALKLIEVFPDAHAYYVKYLVNAGQFEEAIQQAEPSQARTLKEFNEQGRYTPTQARAAYALARTGKRKEAAPLIEWTADDSKNFDEPGRGQIRAILAATLAALGRYRDARLMADSIESDQYRRDAYFAILRLYYADRQ